MTERPVFFSEAQPPDALGRSAQQLWLGEEYLGEFLPTLIISEHGLVKGEPLMSAYRAVWQGEGGDYSKRWLRITLADGREFDARATCLSLAPGAGQPWPEEKPKRKKAAPPEQPGKVQGVQEVLAL